MFARGLVLAVALIPAASGWADEPTLAAQIDRLVEPYVEAKIAVGMVVGVVRGDESVVRGYGRVSLDRPEPPNGKTIYEIGSVTKTFTGLLLADAVVEGRVRLDQPIAELIPEGKRVPKHEEGPIRLKHLATHGSGLPRMPANFSPADPADPYADYSAEDMYDFLGGYSPPRGPEAKSEYSNLAFGLLGQILTDQAGKSYGELLQAEICNPLKMSDTAVELDAKMRRRMAVPYDANLEETGRWHLEAFAGAGAICSTADDMLRYARANLNPSPGPLGEAIELALKTHQPPIASGDFAMGLGWHIAHDGVTRWHNGQTGGYHSMLMIHRPSKAAVVVLSNTATGAIDALAAQILRMLAGAEEEPRVFEKAVEVSLDQMQRLVGRYQLVPGFVLTVKLEGEKLLVGATGQPFSRVYPESETEWKYRVVDASLSFEIAEQGPATAVVLHQNGRDLRAARME